MSGRERTDVKILAVDDEDSIRELLELQLKRNGYETLTAADGQAALEQAAKADLVLLDVMLPGIDGFEVCRRLKADPSTQAIPVIMLTAKAEEIDKVLGLELGADDYMVKPFSVRELLARIKAVLRRSQGSQPAVEQQLTIGPLVMDFSSYTARIGSERLMLTPKEYELLKLLVTNPGRAFMRDELLDASGAMSIMATPGPWMFISAICGPSWPRCRNWLKPSRPYEASVIALQEKNKKTWYSWKIIFPGYHVFCCMFT